MTAAADALTVTDLPTEVDAAAVHATTPAVPEELVATLPNKSQHPYRVMTMIYVREADGLMYKAIIRRALFGCKFRRPQAQLAMGETGEDDDHDDDASRNSNDVAVRRRPDDEDEDDVDTLYPTMWHYFVHFPGWKVSYDRWTSEPDVFDVDAETIAYVDQLNKEHKALHKQMRNDCSSSAKKGKKMKRQQNVSGIQFLAEWSKRMNQITNALPDGGHLKKALQRCQSFRQQAQPSRREKKQEALSPETPQNLKEETKDECTTTTPTTTIQVKRRRNMSLLPLSPEIVRTEMKLRKDGLTTRLRSKIAITLPFGLKKILVEQWELICQCGMLPILPPPITIQDALEAYVNSKGIPSSELIDPRASGTVVSKPKLESHPFESSIPTPSSTAMHEWRIMADGIIQMFNESLPIRLLYDQEIPQFERMFLDPGSSSPSASSLSPRPRCYAGVYGCEHLLRLFVKLPDIMDDNNLDQQQTRPIVAKVNDLIRFLHKNHGMYFQQQNQTTTTTNIGRFDSDAPGPSSKKPKSY